MAWTNVEERRDTDRSDLPACHRRVGLPRDSLLIVASPWCPSLLASQRCPFKHVLAEMGSCTYATIVALALCGAPNHALTVSGWRPRERELCTSVWRPEDHSAGQRGGRAGHAVFQRLLGASSAR